MADKKNLLLLFDRPQEPVFLAKGKNTVFDIPDNFYTDRYQTISDELQDKWSSGTEQRIPVKAIRLPDLKVPMTLDRKQQFSLFIPLHRRVAGSLIDIFMGMPSIEELQSCAVYARDRVNPHLFHYCLSVALLHRADTKSLNLPALIQTFPDKFVDSKVFAKIREEASVVPEQQRMPIIIPKDYTASDLDPEHRLWYFREDMGVNVHHWHWHLIYPYESTNRALVDKDRRGELFYYMHQQLIARYNFERLCNDLPRVKRFNNLRDPIPGGYFPKLDTLIASRSYSPRFENSKLQDLDREQDQIKLDISDMERWRSRIYEAIHQGFVVDDKGNRIQLDDTKGIDVLGNVLESSILSPNRQLYGDFHNMGHVFIGYVHDPNHKHLESFSIMGDNASNLREPVFYMWHAYIDDMFQEHKEMLTPYTLPQLDYRGVRITDVIVKPQEGRQNTFQTFWQQSDVNLSRGIDFVPRGNVFARFTHLQHSPYTYTINISNQGGQPRFGTVRIFLGPKFDERGNEMQFRDQRLLMIELDKFIVQLRPGENTITRRSNESTVTIPFERTFRDLDEGRPTVEGTAEAEQFNYCGCGWPEHMNIPKGRLGGHQCQLFVMVSNYDDDRVDQDASGPCGDAAAYCGIRDRKYPDRRAMGYPFDRLPRQGSDRLSNFITPNMVVKDIPIVFTDKTTVRQN